MKNCMMILFLVCLLSLPTWAAITHRYDFVKDANDVVGGLESTLVGGAEVIDGALVLSGTDQWLEMDAAGTAINTYTDGVSIEMWFTDTAMTEWSRVFDFGDTSGEDGGYTFFYTTSGPGHSRLVLATLGFPGWGTGEDLVNGPVLEPNTKYHVVCVYDAGGGTGGANALRIYQDGILVAANEEAPQLLTNVHNKFAYIGKSVYPIDPEFQGSIDEFRIYDKALSAGEVRFTNYFGPDNAYPIVIRSMTPVDGSSKINITPTLSWTPEPGFSAASYNLYLGTDPNIIDPNVPDVSGCSKVVLTGLPSPSYTIDDEETDPLEFQTTYYWRVDSVAADSTVYQGVGVSFTTRPEIPFFGTNPENNYVFVGETAQFTVECESISPVPWVKWYKEGNPDVEIAAGGRISIVTTGEGDFTTSTLTIANIVAEDEGSYYAKAMNTAGTSSTTSGRIVIKKLVAYWTFDNTLADASGNGYDGTCIRFSSGDPTTPSYNTAANSVVGTSLNLAGGTTYIDLVDGVADDLSGGLTFNFWAYPTAATNWARFLSFNNGAGSNNIFFSREGSSTTLHFNVYDGAVSTGPVRALDALLLNVWQMFTVTVDLTGATVLYKNGAPIATGQVSVPNFVARTNNWIGRSAWPADGLYRGRLDDMRIWNYALTPVEVATLYTNVRTTEFVCVPDPENPLVYDLTGDCRVNLDDLALMAGSWVECLRVPEEACNW